MWYECGLGLGFRFSVEGRVGPFAFLPRVRVVLSSRKYPVESLLEFKRHGCEKRLQTAINAYESEDSVRNVYNLTILGQNLTIFLDRTRKNPGFLLTQFRFYGRIEYGKNPGRVA